MAVRLHVVGCGRAGRTLARLWREAGEFEIGWIVNRSVESAQQAVGFIGAGQARPDPGPVGERDWLMLGLPDSRIAAVAADVAGTLDAPPALAFHLSGAESARVLAPLTGAVAAVHPVCPFSDPARAVGHFAGSYALGEGDARALELLLPRFAAIGARAIEFRPRDKRLYHAATIAASNFLNVLDDLACSLAADAGLPPDEALGVIVALQRAGLAGIAELGPESALTGPIERGDEAICRRLVDALGRQPVERAELFGALARAAVDLAERKHARAGEASGQAVLRPLFEALSAGGAD